MKRPTLNTRVLVIDDEESVRDSFRTILDPPENPGSEKLDAAAAALFGDDFPDPTPQSRRARPIEFEVDVAREGREGLRMVEAAVADKRPYAVIFCDIRMPGLDGVETIEAIRKHDRRAEVVFVTAYSDHSLDTITERAGANVAYFVKPFVSDEVRQIATKLVFDWNKARELESLIATLSSLGGKLDDVKRLLGYILAQVCSWLNTESAALYRVVDGEPQFYLGIGELADAAHATETVGDLDPSALVDGTKVRDDGVTVLPIESYGIAVALRGHGTVTPDRYFLLELFMRHASLAIKNNLMQARVEQAERLASIGKALGFIVHDLRGPIGTAQMYVQMLRRGLLSGEKSTNALARIDHQLSRALGLVGDKLALCKGQFSVSPTSVELAPALEATIGEWQQAAGAATEVIVDIPAGLHATIDLPVMERALWNLIRNAIRALRGRERGVVRVTARAEGGTTTLAVDDNGPGVPKERCADLFKALSTSSESGEPRTGFGLAIVREIALAHGGSVDVSESELGGARFTISLPDLAAAS